MLLTTALFLAALLYSSVGHGGGSAYIALFHLSGMDAYVASSTALVLNLAVSGTAFFNYRRFFSLKHALPFVVVSVPAAYIGGSMNLSGDVIRTVTGVLVFLAGVRMLVRFRAFKNLKGMETFKRISVSLITGAVLGLVAGIIGIGGGIFLSPVLMFLGLNSKETASISSFFILVNSSGGLLARLRFVHLDPVSTSVWIAVVLVGGAVGSFLGAHRFRNRTVRVLLGLVLIVAGVKLTFT